MAIIWLSIKKDGYINNKFQKSNKTHFQINLNVNFQNLHLY